MVAAERGGERERERERERGVLEEGGCYFSLLVPS